MKTKTNLYLLLASVALLALPAAGCGDSTECGPGTVKLGEKCVADQAIDETPDDLLECGAGTVEADGACVPDGSGADTQCGPKTTLQDGQCVIAADACEAGEMLDPNSGQCVAGGNGGSACGAGTALDAGSDTCIPTEDVCDSGTIFDAASGLCLPDACQVGDVLLAGICVSPAQELAAQADVEESENNDPAQGGSSNALTLKDVGESTVFTGTIGAPADLTGTGEGIQDLDVFDFEAQAGQWLQISLQSTGIPSPAFLVQGPNGYQRLSPQLGGSDTARQLLIPADGTYTVTVAPAAYAATLLANGVPGGPYGGDDWGYVGSIEQINAPAPLDVASSGGVLEGDYATLTDNFFSFTDVAANEGVSLLVETSQASATGILQTWADGTYVGSKPITSGDTINLLSDASGELQVLIDWQTLGGLASDFKLSASTQAGTDGLGPIGADDAVSSDPIDLTYGETMYYTFSAAPGQVIVLNFSNDVIYAPTNIRLTDASGTTLLPHPQDYQNMLSLTPDRYAYSYTKEGGTFLLEVTPGNGFDLDNLIANISTVTPTDLGELVAGDTIQHTSGDSLDPWTSNFYMLSSAETVLVSGQIEGDAGVQIAARFLSESNALVAERGSQNSPLPIRQTVLHAGKTLLEVAAINAGHAAHTVNLTVAEVPQVEVEPNGGPTLATPFDISAALYGSVSESVDDDYYSFTVPSDMGADEVFSLALKPIDSANTGYTCTLSDSNGDPVGANNPNALSNGCMVLASNLQASQTYYFHIHAQRMHPSSPLNYVLSASIDSGLLEVEANDVAASATPFDLAALQAGTSLFGALPVFADTDYFAFELDADMAPGETIILELAQIGPFMFQYGNWSVRDAAENTLYSGALNVPLIVENLDAGTHYIVLTRNSSNPSQALVYRIDAF